MEFQELCTCFELILFISGAESPRHIFSKFLRQFATWKCLEASRFTFPFTAIIECETKSLSTSFAMTSAHLYRFDKPSPVTCGLSAHFRRQTTSARKKNCDSHVNPKLKAAKLIADASSEKRFWWMSCILSPKDKVTWRKWRELFIVSRVQWVNRCCILSMQRLEWLLYSATGNSALFSR